MPPLRRTGVPPWEKRAGWPDSMLAAPPPHSPKVKRKDSSGVAPNRKALKSPLAPSNPCAVNSTLRSPKNSSSAAAAHKPGQVPSNRPSVTFQAEEGAQPLPVQSREEKRIRESGLENDSSSTMLKGGSLFLLCIERK